MGCAVVFARKSHRDDSQGPFNPDRLRQAREVRGLSEERLATMLDMEPDIIVAIEEGRTSPNRALWLWFAMILDFPEPFFRKRQDDRAESPLNPAFICGDGIAPCHHCARLAEFLCDYPLGGRRTCSMPLCEQHRRRQAGLGVDLDFCPAHAASVPQPAASPARLALAAMPDKG